MTVEPYEATGTIAPYDPDIYGSAIPGLEGFDPSKVAVPRWNINHDKGVFVDSLTKEERETLDVVMLGLQIQRIVWAEKMGDSDSPLCKSRDGLTGYPLLEPNGPKNLVFPWGESPFTADNLETDVNGNSTLPCAVCTLKDWKGKGKDADPPRCNEQYTFILCDKFGVEQALFTVQKTGIKSAKQYITNFIRAKKPMFTVNTTISLLEVRSGGRTYCVPEYRKGEPTEQDMWEDYANTARQIKEFLVLPPASGNTATGDGSGSAAASASTAVGLTPGVPASPAATREIKKPPVRVAAAPAKVEPFIPADDNDDLPF